MIMTIGGLVLFAVVVLGVVGFIIIKITQCRCTASLFAQSACSGDKVHILPSHMVFEMPSHMTSSGIEAETHCMCTS